MRNSLSETTLPAYTSSVDLFSEESLSNQDSLPPSYSFALKQELAPRSPEQQKAQQMQQQEEQTPAPLSHFHTVPSYLISQWQTTTRSNKSNSAVKQRLGVSDIEVYQSQPHSEGFFSKTNIDWNYVYGAMSGKTCLTEAKFKELRQLYKKINNEITYQDCNATRPAIRRKMWQLINPETIVKLNDGTSLNANYIDDIKCPSGKKLALVASMMIDNQKPKQVKAFTEFMIQQKKKGIIVNLTESKEGSLYMPLGADDRVEFGATATSWFGKNRDEYKLNKPHVFQRVGAVEDDFRSQLKFCDIQIRDIGERTLHTKPITFVSFPFKDHDPVSYPDLRKCVGQIQTLVEQGGAEDEQFCLIHCQGGMGRASQVSIALMMEAEIDNEDETPEALLERMVKKYYGARRPGAVNEYGFFALYCYARERKREIAADKAARYFWRPSSTPSLFNFSEEDAQSVTGEEIEAAMLAALWAEIEEQRIKEEAEQRDTTEKSNVSHLNPNIYRPLPGHPQAFDVIQEKVRLKKPAVPNPLADAPAKPASPNRVTSPATEKLPTPAVSQLRSERQPNSSEFPRKIDLSNRQIYQPILPIADEVPHLNPRKEVPQKPSVVNRSTSSIGASISSGNLNQGKAYPVRAEILQTKSGELPEARQSAFIEAGTVASLRAIFDYSEREKGQEKGGRKRGVPKPSDLWR